MSENSLQEYATEAELRLMEQLERADINDPSILVKETAASAIEKILYHYNNKGLPEEKAVAIINNICKILPIYNNPKINAASVAIFICNIAEEHDRADIIATAKTLLMEFCYYHSGFFSQEVQDDSRGNYGYLLISLMVGKGYHIKDPNFFCNFCRSPDQFSALFICAYTRANYELLYALKRRHRHKLMQSKHAKELIPALDYLDSFTPKYRHNIPTFNEACISSLLNSAADPFVNVRNSASVFALTLELLQDQYQEVNIKPPNHLEVRLIQILKCGRKTFFEIVDLCSIAEKQTLLCFMCHTRMQWAPHPENKVLLIHETEDIIYLCKQLDENFLGTYPLHRALVGTHYQQEGLKKSGIDFVKALLEIENIPKNKAFKHNWFKSKIPVDLTDNGELLSLLSSDSNKKIKKILPARK